MPIDSEILKIKPWASDAAATKIEPEDGDPAVDRSVGFPASFSSSGGDTPERGMMNQIFAELYGISSELIRFGILPWDARLDYAQHATVQHSGFLWRAGVATGPTTSNATEPGSDGDSVWTRINTEHTATAPGKPDAPVGVAASRTVTFIWRAPNDNGAPILTYTLIWWPEGSNEASATEVVTTGTRHVLTGLVNGRRYYAKVRAANAEGHGPFSDSGSLVPQASTPSAVIGVVAQATTSTSIRVTWGVPLDDGGATVTRYDIQWKSGSQSFASSRQRSSTDRIETFTGLQINRTYDYRVRAINARGNGEWSATASASTTATEPAQVSGLVATAGDNQIALRWTAPNNGGSPITRYDIRWKSGNQAYDGQRQDTTVSTSYTLTRLSNGTEYDLQVRAVNAVGLSEWSGTISAIPFNQPTLSQNNITLRGKGVRQTATLSPASGGQAPFTYSLSGLTNNVTFDGANRVVGVPAGVDGTDTLTYTATDSLNKTATIRFLLDYDTRTTAPSEPRNLSLSRSDRQISASWDAPTDNGGSAITGYVIEVWPGTRTTSNVRELTTAGRSVGIGSLTNGTEYSVRVKARNSVGDSDWSGTAQATPLATLRLVQSNITVNTPYESQTVSLSRATGGSNSFTYAVNGLGQSTITYSSSSHRLTIPRGINGTINLTLVATDTRDGSITSDAFAVTYDTRAKVPEQVTGVSATEGDGRVTLGWREPTDGGSSITSYTVQWKSGAQSFGSARQATTTSRSRTVTGLLNGREYEFRVAAVNRIGFGEWSETVSATPFRSLNIFQNNLTLTGTSAGVNSTLSAATGGDGNYTYDLTEDDGSALPAGVSFAASSRRLTVGANRNGSVDLTYSVTDGTGTTDSVDFTLTYDTRAKVPSQVTSISVTPGNARNSLSWSAPSANGASITSYIVQWKSGAQSFGSARQATTTSRSYTHTGLTNGTEYTYRIRARNARGSGQWSDDVSATPTAPLTLGIGNITAESDNTATSTTFNTANGGDGNYTYAILPSTNFPTGIAAASDFSTSRTINIAAGISGRFTVWVRVTDGTGVTDDESFLLIYDTTEDDPYVYTYSGTSRVVPPVGAVAYTWQGVTTPYGSSLTTTSLAYIVTGDGETARTISVSTFDTAFGNDLTTTGTVNWYRSTGLQQTELFTRESVTISWTRS